MLQRTGKRHDLIGVVLSDPREGELPAVGLLEVSDAETGKTMLVDTGHPGVRSALQRRPSERLESLRQLAQSSRASI